MLKACKKYVITLSIFLVLASVSSYRIMLSPGVISYHDWGIPPYADQIVDYSKSVYYLWHSSFGGSDFSTINFLNAPWTVLGILGFLGINGDLISKGMVVLFLMLSGFSVYYMCLFLKKSYTSSILAGIFYMFTPLMYNKIVSGSWQIMGYSLVPLILVFFIKSVDAEDKKIEIKNSLIAALFFSFVELRLIFLYLGLLVSYSVMDVLYSNRKKLKLVLNLKSLFIIFCMVFLLYAYYFLPIIHGISTGQPLTIHDVLLRSRFSQLINTIRLSGFVMPWFSDAVGNTPFIWTFTSFSLTGLIWSSMIFQKRNKDTVFFSLVAIITIFLGKGVNPPFGNVYDWMFLNIPFFQAFRDPQVFVVLTSLAYAYLLCVGAQSIYCSVEKHTKANIAEKKHHYFAVFTTLVLCSTILINSWPFLTGNFNGELKTTSFSREYRTVDNWLGAQSDDFRVAWIPADEKITYEWAPQEQGDLISGYSSKPTFFGKKTLDSRGRFSDFVISTLYNNRTNYLGKLLGIGNVKYVILREDAESYNLYQTMNLKKFSRSQSEYALKHQKDIKLIRTEGSISIFRNEHYLPRVFVTNSASIIAGGYSSLVSLSYLDKFIFDDSAIFFADQLSSSDYQKISKYIDTVIIQNGRLNDLVFSFLSKEYKIDPSIYANLYDPEKYWSKLFYYNWWYDWHYLDSTNESAFTRGKAMLEIPFQVKSSEKYDVWMKISFGVNGGRLGIVIDNKTTYEINTKSLNNVEFLWLRLGSIDLTSGEHVIVLQNLEGENVVASIIIAPPRYISKATDALLQFLYDKKVTGIFEPEKFRLYNDPRGGSTRSPWTIRRSDCLRSECLSPLLPW